MLDARYQFMLIRLDGSGPRHRQIHAALRRAILDGVMISGVRLPATRAMASELGVSRNTVLAAYDQLIAEGYVEARPGSGTFVVEELPQERIERATQSGSRSAPSGGVAPRLSAAGDRLARAGRQLVSSERAREPQWACDFRYGMPSVRDFPLALWRRAVSRCLRPASRCAMGYGAAAGASALREAVTGYLQRSRGVRCSADQVVITSGSQQALHLTASLLVGEGDEVAIEDPQYRGARLTLEAAGARLCPIAVDELGMRVDRLRRQAASARLVYVTPSHQFPTGATLPLSRRLALLEWASAENAFVVEDDYDSEYRYDALPIESMQGIDQQGRVIYVGTFSKVLFPALRIGYLVLPPSLVEPFLAAKALIDRGQAMLEPSALARFLEEGHFERHLRRTRARNRERRDALVAALGRHAPGVGRITGGEAGMHLVLWLDGRTETEIERLMERCERSGVKLQSVGPCFLRDPKGVGLVLGFSALEEAEIDLGVRCLARELRRPD